MKTKWWRWWIVPVILTILFVIIFAMVVLFISQGGEISFLENSLFLLTLLFALTYLGDYFIFVPLFLGLVWLAAFVIHVVWKRREAKKQGVLEVQPGPKDAI